MTDKRALRAHFLHLRERTKSAEKDEAITENLIRSPYFAAERFFVYCSVRSEVATDKLIAALLAAGKQVCVPRIEGGVMLAVPYAKLERGAFGIPAPRGGEDTVCDVALTPLLAADRTGVRLGYGGGYYDAYFAKRPQTLRVGLAYEAQLTQSLPHEAWDMPLQAVVTEKGTHCFPLLDSTPADTL